LRVFLLSGKARSGKGTVANIIKKYYREKCIEMMFAKTIKQYAIDFMGWDGSDENKPRKFLQTIGTDVIRDKLNNPNFHWNRVAEDIDILKHYFDNFVISDCRFPNEADLSKEKFGEKCVLLRLERDWTNLTKEQQNHKSETALDNYENWDYVIKNNGSISELEEKITHILDSLDRISCSEMEQ